MKQRRRFAASSPDAPRAIAGSVENVLRHLNAPVASTVTAVFDRWEEIAGPTMAAHTEPVQLSDGVLVISADDPAWASQLQWDATRLLAQVQAVAKDTSITRIQTRVRRAR